MTMQPATNTTGMRQRSDLTYKQNTKHGRHGWLRLTPAYSVRLVDQVLAEFGSDARSVFEPFSGTGTTPLCAAYAGFRALATDINPFLIWLGRVKAATYSPADLLALQKATKAICGKLVAGTARPAALPPLKNIERWWHPEELAFVTSLRGEVEHVPNGAVRDLLKVAFCRTMIALSNAAFNHQSMSFKSTALPRQALLPLGAQDSPFLAQFVRDVGVVAEGCLDNPVGAAQIELADSRKASVLEAYGEPFDLLITSPPYPNRMSYIRELRPYMYWLGFLGEAKEAGELDWEAIGGTWGIATSRLTTWSATDSFIPDYLHPILDKIREGHPKNGDLMGQYVHKYFDDMFQHFVTVAPHIKVGGTVHYIVGNSTFYGHIVPAEQLYVDQLTKAGFRNATAKAIRKRNSKKELIEFHVMAQR